ncbi:hypothetical protein CDAR_64921 [Caerostris darwini]|uniref:Uncharacterized protein n=1 Tax=Caerostris darwini TaxID=1538125 RepID=A0AAV4VY54_9ARAC|nr:hypothetical protein CDAR_64921 [Caerostris darwini]
MSSILKHENNDVFDMFNFIHQLPLMTFNLQSSKIYGMVHSVIEVRAEHFAQGKLSSKFQLRVSDIIKLEISIGGGNDGQDIIQISQGKPSTKCYETKEIMIRRDSCQD